MDLEINGQIHLSGIHPSDKSSLIRCLNEREIYDRTLRIPHPYTGEAADKWLAIVARNTEREGRPIHWAVRDAEQILIGGCGFDGLRIGKSHRAEIGYWLAKPYWGNGIMTAVVQKLCDYAFTEFGLVRVPSFAAPIPEDSQIVAFSSRVPIIWKWLGPDYPQGTLPACMISFKPQPGSVQYVSINWSVSDPA